MKPKLWRQLSLSALIALSCGTAALAESPIFSKYTYEQAKQQAQKEGKVLLMDFTASWCPPCKKMETTTWIDEEVQSWIKENAIAVQFDVDKDQKTAEIMHIEAMPTIILFTAKSGSKEFGRQVGYMGAAELLRWLKSAKGRKASVDSEATQADAGSGESSDASAANSTGASSNSVDIWSHVNKAREAATSGKNDEALTEYVWLWNNLSTTDESERDLRKGLIPHEVKKLFAVHPPAKAKFMEIRDAAEKSDKRGDWIILNGMLGDNARTVAWFDKVKLDPKQRAVFQKHMKSLEVVLFSENRWADAATYLYVDPIARLSEIYKEAEAMKKPRPDTEISKDFDPLPSMVLLLYGTYVGAGRDADAKKIEDECIRLDDTPAMRTGLANMAKGMKLAREQHQKKAAK